MSPCSRILKATTYTRIGFTEVLSSLVFIVRATKEIPNKFTFYALFCPCIFTFVFLKFMFGTFKYVVVRSDYSKNGLIDGSDDVRDVMKYFRRYERFYGLIHITKRRTNIL